MKDQFNDIQPSGAAVVTVTDNTPVVSGIVDVRDYQSATFVVLAGTLADADATFTVLVEEGDEPDLSDAAGVADADLLGTELLAGFQFDDDGESRKVGYIGDKRYVRCTVTPANNTGSAPVAVVAVLGNPKMAPTSNPPA